jgi:hypothetical protein
MLPQSRSASTARLLRDPDRRTMLELYLAHRALNNLPVRRLERMTGEETGASQQWLAEAELGRPGLRR